MLVGIAALSVAGLAAAQPSNTIGRGPVTTSHLPVVDDDGTPGPSAGDTPIGMTLVTYMSQQAFQLDTPAGDLIVGGSNQQGGSGPLQTFEILNHPYETQRLTFSQFDGQDHPTGADIVVTSKIEIPAKKRSLVLPVLGTGASQLHALNGEGFHDGVAGAKTGGGFSFDLDFVYATSPGSNAPDYISLPWADVQTLALQVKGGKSGGLANQVWVPLTVTPGTTKPSSITANLGVPLFDSPPLAAPGPPPSGFRPNIPMLSGWGIVVISLALAFLGWRQLERGGTSLGV
jgi:hypothetical protein